MPCEQISNLQILSIAIPKPHQKLQFAHFSKPIRLGGTRLSRVGITMSQPQSLSLYHHLVRTRIFPGHSLSPISEVVRLNAPSAECSLISCDWWIKPSSLIKRLCRISHQIPCVHP